MVGDTASCVSLLAVRGSGLAYGGGVCPCSELRLADGDNAEAIERHQSLFWPFVLNRQKATLRFAGTFFWQSPGLQILL